MMENYKLNCNHKVYILLFLFLCFLSCQKKIESKTFFEEKLSQIKPRTEFTLDSIKNGKWEKCYIVPPYQQYNSLLNKIDLNNDDLNKIKENAIYDGVNTFVFINNDGSVSIETVSRDIFDIANEYLDSIYIFYPTTLIKIGEKRKIINSN